MLLSASPTPSIPAAHLIHVKTRVLNPFLATTILANGAADGLVQVFGTYNTGPHKVITSVWVYVVHGQVGMGVGNGGNTSSNIKSSVLGHWQHLIGVNSVSPANEFILYSVAPNGPEYYADDAIVRSARPPKRCRSHISASGPPVPLLP